MTPEDRNDIINKIEKSGSDDTPSNDDFGDSISGGSDDSDGGEQEDEPTEENVIHETNPSGIEILPKDHKQVFVNAKLGVEEDLDESKNTLSESCWKGYKQVGMKEKDGKQVPNCVPIDEAENKKLGGLSDNLNMSIFAENSIRKNIVKIIKEMKESPVKEPTVIPVVKPNEQPTRRQRPWRINPNPNPEPKAMNEGVDDSSKVINIKGLDEMKDLIGGDTERLKAISNSIRNEISNGEIHNNTIVTTDNQDTNWIFIVLKIDDKIYLEFNGTAK